MASCMVKHRIKWRHRRQAASGKHLKIDDCLPNSRLMHDVHTPKVFAFHKPTQSLYCTLEQCYCCTLPRLLFINLKPEFVRVFLIGFSSHISEWAIWRRRKIKDARENAALLLLHFSHVSYRAVVSVPSRWSNNCKIKSFIVCSRSRNKTKNSSTVFYNEIRTYIFVATAFCHKIHIFYSVEKEAEIWRWSACRKTPHTHTYKTKK